MTPLLPAFAGTPEKNQVYNLDLFDLCAAMPSQSVDMIFCDLPYGTTACAWDTVIPFEPMWKAFKRIIKPRGAIVLTASQPFTSALVMSNVKMFRYEWMWDKVTPSGFMNVHKMPMKSHESILVFSELASMFYPQKTKKTYKGARTGNGYTKAGEIRAREVYRDLANGSGHRSVDSFPKSVIQFPTGNGWDKINNVHPTQKPVDLFRYLIRTYTLPNELVFDPCVGSGTTAIAAREEGRAFIVGDSSLEYVEVARNRLAQPFTPSFMPQLEMTA